MSNQKYIWLHQTFQQNSLFCCYASLCSTWGIHKNKQNKYRLDNFRATIHETFIHIYSVYQKLCSYQFDKKVIKPRPFMFFLTFCCSIVCQCTQVCFASFLYDGFITAIVVTQLERKLAKCTSVQWDEIFYLLNFFPPMIAQH